MTFVDAVQKSHIAGPQQLAYSELDWREGFAGTTDGSERDRRLHASGLWFADRFASARRALDELPALPGTPVQLARALVGLTNYQTTNASAELERNFLNQDSGTSAARFPEILELATDLAEKVQHLVSSLRIPLATAFAGIEPQRPAKEDGDILVCGLPLRVELGQHHDALERLWLECVWNDWHVEAGPSVDTVRPSEVARERWRAAAQFRRDSLLTESAYLSLGMWKRAGQAQRHAWAAGRVVIGASRHGKRLKFAIGQVDLSRDRPPSPWIARVAAVDQYLIGIVDEPLPMFDGVSIRELLDSHYLLAPLAELLAGDARELQSLSLDSDLDACAPRIHHEDLCTAIALGLNVDATKARAIVAALTFDKTPRDEPWLKPFVPLEGPWLTVVLEPLRSPNLLWAVDRWLNAGGYNMAARGPSFEQYIREELQEAATLPNVTIARTGLELRGKGQMEEIDFVARVGSTILIGEAKCSVYPTEPHHLARYESVLRKGADQASRKAAFVEDNRELFLKATGFDDLTAESMRVVPIVITNLSLGAALPRSAAAVTDLHILRRYLSDGRLAQFAALHPDGTTSAQRELLFYDTADEAAELIGSYLSEPPQLSVLLPSTIASYRPLFCFSGEKPVQFMVVRTEPFEELRALDALL